MKQYPKQKRTFVQVGKIIQDIFKQRNLRKSAAFVQIWDIWEEAVGSHIAVNAWPASFKDDLLIVHTTSSSWLQQLRFLKKDILLKVNERLGEACVRDIKFKIGPVNK